MTAEQFRLFLARDFMLLAIISIGLATYAFTVLHSPPLAAFCGFLGVMLFYLADENYRLAIE